MPIILKMIELIVYIAGAIYISTIFHELYHFYFCGGRLAAGLYYDSTTGELFLGTTWCERVIVSILADGKEVFSKSRFDNELIPEVLSDMLLVVLLWLKFVVDRPKWQKNH